MGRTMFVCATLALVVPCAADSTRIVLYTVEDSYISGWDPGVNYGPEDTIRVGDGGTLEYRTYVKFDLSELPEGLNITACRVGLNANLNYGGVVCVHYLEDDNWDEQTITWNNAPTAFVSTPTDSLDPNIYWNYWVVTDDVIDAYNGDGIYSAVFKMSQASPGGEWNYFVSRDDSYPEWPVLEVYVSGEKYGGGEGTEQSPYLIYTPSQLKQIGDNWEDWDKHFRLMADIDLSDYDGVDFHIISNDWQEPFMGVFDGAWHVISNLTFDTEAFFNYVGLFGAIGAGSEIRNVGIQFPKMHGEGNGVGALVGCVTGGIVRNCWAEDVNIWGAFRAGGLIGQLYEGEVSDSYADGGYVYVEHDFGGGLVGENDAAILRCYSTCAVSGVWLGGLVGYSDGGTVTSSYWDTQTSGLLYSNGGTGRTTSQMKSEGTYAGWDFTRMDGDRADWQMPPGDYPRLAPQLFDRVNLVALALLASHWGMTDCDETQPCSEADWFIDETIDLLDLAQLALSWLSEGIIYDSLPLPEITDGFESGDFTALPWMRTGNANWTVVSAGPYQGTHAAKSGTITHNQSTTLEVTVDASAFNTISFARKVSSEANWDYLRFYIDGVENNKWAGTLDWAVQTFTFPPGQRTFKWSYTKDGSINSGSDCAWLDDIRIYLQP